MKVESIKPDVSGYSFNSLEYLISTNYLSDGINGPEESRLIFIACCNELLRRLNEERSWEQLSKPFPKFESFKYEQLSLF